MFFVAKLVAKVNQCCNDFLQSYSCHSFWWAIHLLTRIVHLCSRRLSPFELTFMSETVGTTINIMTGTAIRLMAIVVIPMAAEQASTV